MTWNKREAVTNLVILGDGEGHCKKVGGLLVATPNDSGYPDKINYVIVKKDGEEITLSGSASLARQLNERDVGKFIRCEFMGWGKSNNGKFKAIDVNVWEGEPDETMKKWPRFAEFATAAKRPTPAVAKPAAQPADDFDDFPSNLGGDEDDLPF